MAISTKLLGTTALVSNALYGLSGNKKNNEKSNTQGSSLTTDDLQALRKASLAGSALEGFIDYRTKSQQYQQQRDVFSYNAEQERNDGFFRAAQITKSNTYKLGRDKVSYGTSGVVGGSKLQALADNSVTREMNVAREIYTAKAREMELNMAADAANKKAKTANIFSILSSIPPAVNFYTWQKSTKQASDKTGQKSEYLGY